MERGVSEEEEMMSSLDAERMFTSLKRKEANLNFI